LFYFVVLLGGCASPSLESARQAYFHGDSKTAAILLDEEVSEASQNRLLLLMEQGFILFADGDYRRSIEVLQQASRLIEEQETISLLDESASLLTGEWAKRYPGEYSEHLWVHTCLMLDYLLLSDLESAQVEARRTLPLLQDHRDVLAQAYFTRSLTALCFELVGEDNDAWIEYKRLADDWPAARNLIPLQKHLAQKLDFTDMLQQWQDAPSWPFLDSGHGELVLFVTAGKIPVKSSGDILVPPGIRVSFPRYLLNRYPAAHLHIDTGTEFPVNYFEVSTDTGDVARSALQSRGLQVAAKEAASIVAKEAVTQALERENELLGALFRITMIISSSADTRSWQTLPARFSMVRMVLPVGDYDVRITLPGWGSIIEPVSVIAGRFHFTHINF